MRGSILYELLQFVDQFLRTCNNFATSCLQPGQPALARYPRNRRRRHFPGSGCAQAGLSGSLPEIDGVGQRLCGQPGGALPRRGHGQRQLGLCIGRAGRGHVVL